MSKKRIKLIRQAFESINGFDRLHRKLDVYKKMWRQFKKEVKNG